MPVQRPMQRKDREKISNRRAVHTTHPWVGQRRSPQAQNRQRCCRRSGFGGPDSKKQRSCRSGATTQARANAGLSTGVPAADFWPAVKAVWRLTHRALAEALPAPPRRRIARSVPDPASNLPYLAHTKGPSPRHRSRPGH